MLKNKNTALNIFHFLLLFILIILPFIFSFSFSDYFIFPKENFFVISVLIALNLYLCLLLLNKENKIYYPQNYQLPLLILFFIFLFFFWQKNKSLNFTPVFFYLILAIYFFLLTQTIQTKQEDILFLINLAALCLGIIYFFQYFNVDILNQYYLTKVPPKFLALTFGHKNLVGEFMLFLIPVSFYTFLNETQKVKKYFGFLALFLSVLVIITSLSRSSYLGMIIQFLLFIKVFQKIRKKFLLIVFLCFLCSVVLLKYSSLNLDQIKSKFSLNYEIGSGSLMQRYFIWKVGKEMFLVNPITGIGSANISYLFLNYFNKLTLADKITYHYLKFPQENITYIHNDFLQILAEFGIIIFFLFFLWVFILIKSAYLSTDLIKVAISIALIGILVDSFFAYPLHYITSLVYFIFYLTLIQENKNFVLSKKLPVFLITFFVILTTIFIFQRQIKVLASGYYSQQAKLSLRDNKYYIDKPLKAANKAIELNKKNYGAYFYLGNIYFYVKNYNEALKNYGLAKRGISDLNLYLKYAQSAYFAKRYLEVKKQCDFVLSLYLYDEHIKMCYWLLSQVYKKEKDKKNLYYKNLYKINEK